MFKNVETDIAQGCYTYFGNNFVIHQEREKHMFGKRKLT